MEQDFPEKVVKKVDELLEGSKVLGNNWLMLPQISSKDSDCPTDFLNFQHFLNRISSFDQLTWGIYPDIILKLACHGWSAQRFNVVCTICNASIDCSKFENISAALPQFIKKAHKAYCWNNIAAPDTWIDIPIVGPNTTFRNVKDTCLKLTIAGDSLPKIYHEVLEELGLDGKYEKFMELMNVSQSECYKSALVLTLCGWFWLKEPGSLTCKFCQRSFHLSNYASIEDAQNCPEVANLQLEISLSDMSYNEEGDTSSVSKDECSKDDFKESVGCFYKTLSLSSRDVQYFLPSGDILDLPSTSNMANEYRIFKSRFTAKFLQRKRRRAVRMINKCLKRKFVNINSCEEFEENIRTSCVSSPVSGREMSEDKQSEIKTDQVTENVIEVTKNHERNPQTENSAELKSEEINKMKVDEVSTADDEKLLNDDDDDDKNSDEDCRDKTDAEDVTSNPKSQTKRKRKASFSLDKRPNKKLKSSVDRLAKFVSPFSKPLFQPVNDHHFWCIWRCGQEPGWKKYIDSFIAGIAMKSQSKKNVLLSDVQNVCGLISTWSSTRLHEVTSES